MRIFLSGVSCVGKTTIGKRLAEEVEYKFLFYNAIERFASENQNNAMGNSADPNALALSCWGLVHGMAILIAKKDFFLRAIIWNLLKKFFGAERF